MKKSKSIKNYLLHIHALNNAGNSVPIEVTELLSTHDALPLEIKVAAVEGLGGRLEEGVKVENFIHRLIRNKKVHENIKVSALSAIQNSDSVNGLSFWKKN